MNVMQGEKDAIDYAARQQDRATRALLMVENKAEFIQANQDRIRQLEMEIDQLRNNNTSPQPINKRPPQRPPPPVPPRKRTITTPE
jgi:hypothetical protein